MSYNPVRAKNFNRNTSKRTRKSMPKDGVKHSDIARRNGTLTTIPVESRIRTDHGFSTTAFAGESFAVRVELISAGNSTGFGVNKKSDRVYIVRQGLLYAFVNGPKGERQVLQFQPGKVFNAPKGLEHGIASSGNEGVELLIIEGSDYADNWIASEDNTTRDVDDATLASVTPDRAVTTAQRRPSNPRAKAVAAQQASKANKRRGKRTGTKSSAASASTSGEKRLGRKPAGNANSPNAVGVNPMPQMPTGD